MKRYTLLYIAAAAVAMGAASCSNADGDKYLFSTEFLNVPASHVNISAQSLEGTFEVRANCAWKISGKPDWIQEISPISGSSNATVTIKCQQNPSSTDERTVTLEVAAGSGAISRSITVTQPKADESLTVSKNSLSFNSDGGSDKLTIICNRSWTISKPEWFSVVDSEGKEITSGNDNQDITVIVPSTTDTNEREGKLVIQAGGKSQTVTVTQSSFVETLTVSTSNLSFTVAGGEKSFTITTNVDWNITGTGNWFKLSATSGTGPSIHTQTNTEKITVTVDPSYLESKNEVTLTIKGLRKEEKVVITQDAFTEKVEPAALNSFEATGGTQDWSIKSNVPWEITEWPDWITLDKTKGAGPSTNTTDVSESIKITAEASALESTRVGTLQIKAKNHTYSVEVTQDPVIKTLAIDPIVINADTKGGTYTINVVGDATWTAQVNQDWGRLDKLQGVGEATVTATIDPNYSTSSRECIISFIRPNGETLNCTVTQAAAKLPQLTQVVEQDKTKYSFVVSSSFTSMYPVSEYGFCYSLSNTEPTTSDTKLSTKTTGDPLSGEFTDTATNLVSGKTYYIRAYAISAVGTSYSLVQDITTGGQVPGADDNHTPEI